MADWKRSQRLVVAVLAFCVVLMAAAEPARACSCLQPSIESSYNRSTDVVRAQIVLRLSVGQNVIYVARVQKAYKGCLTAGRYVALSTPSSSAACGISLEPAEYLINGSAAGSYLGLPRLNVHLCDYNRKWRDLTPDDHTFLGARTVCCGDRCTCANGSAPVQCFVDPCSVAPSCPDGQCVANYCGGCNAEFYDESGYAVCQGECEEDADCPPDEWCRQRAPASSGSPSTALECVPFASEDESCNGFTTPWSYERCAPGLTCDTPNDVIDAPGVCRRSCRADGDCAVGQYCASENLCQDDGPRECATDADCMVTGCSGQVCAGQPVITTCEWHPEYACYRDPTITSCGCTAGRCGWDATAALKECLMGGGELAASQAH